MPFCNLKKKQPFLTVQFHIFGFSSFSLWGSASPEIFELNTVLSSFNKGICCSHTCFNFSTSLPILCLMATCLPSVSGHSYCFWLLGFPEVLWLDLFFSAMAFLQEDSHPSLLVIPIIYWPPRFYGPHYNAFSPPVIFFVLEN